MCGTPLLQCGPCPWQANSAGNKPPGLKFTDTARQFGVGIKMNPKGIYARESPIRSLSARFRLADLRWYGLAALSVGVALGSALLLQHFHFRDAAVPLLALACAITSWYVGVGPALLALVLSSMWFAYFFVEPIYSFRVRASELPYFMIFVSFALLVSWFATIGGASKKTLRRNRDRLAIEVEERTQQTNLLNLTLNLTHDAIFVRDMNAVINYWNRGAEELYGWTAEEAIGKRSHELFRTVFPAPIADISAELLRTGRWEGELNHTKPDGSRVVVLSRWSLRRDERGRPAAILETNNDITDRKRKEAEVERLNQELARRSIALEASNKDLEAFAYSIWRDLRARLRHMAGFAELLRKHAAAALNRRARTM